MRGIDTETSEHAHEPFVPTIMVIRADGNASMLRVGKILEPHALH